MSPARKGRPRVADLDRRIGQRVRELRIARGITQQQLAERIGVTYQQAHKYEGGINRIAAGRLLSIAEVLAVEPADLLALPERPAPRPSEGDLRGLVAAQLFAQLEAEEQHVIVALLRVMAR